MFVDERTNATGTSRTPKLDACETTVVEKVIMTTTGLVFLLAFGLLANWLTGR